MNVIRRILGANLTKREDRNLMVGTIMAIRQVHRNHISRCGRPATHITFPKLYFAARRAGSTQQTDVSWPSFNEMGMMRG